MNWAKGKVWVYRVGIVLGALIFLYQVISGFQAFQPVHLPASFWKIALWSIPGMTLAIGLQIINFKFLLQSIGVNLKLVNLCKGYILSSLPKYIPGSVWIFISRSQWLNQDFGIPHGVTNLANLLEIGVTLVAAGGVILLGLGFVSGSWFYLLAALLLPAVILALFQTFVQIIRRNSWFELAIFPGQLSLNNRFLWLATLVCEVEWMVLGGATLLLAAGVLPQVTFSLGSWMLVTQSFTLAWLAGFFVIFVPAGLGIRELALTGLIMTNFSADYQTATLAAIGSRFIFSTGELIWLGIGLLLKADKPKKLIKLG
jgi:hypothetical protein